MNEYTQISQSVLVVDDHILFREGLVSLFNSTPDFRVVDQAGTVREGMAKVLRFKQDIILMDFSLPDCTGLDAIRVILDELPESKIIFLTICETNNDLVKAIHLGARGYLSKSVSSSSFLASLRAFAEGEADSSRKSVMPEIHSEKN